jgi:hypothetical protein
MMKISVIFLAAFALAASSAEARAAWLRVSVSPVKVHPGGPYTVSISGRYDRRAMHRTPYLLAFIQYRPGRCKRTATAEYALPGADWSWDFYPPSTEPRSPFVRVVHWTAESRLGTRHVCAYLYAHKISPISAAKPMAWASATFTDAKG